MERCFHNPVNTKDKEVYGPLGMLYEAGEDEDTWSLVNTVEKLEAALKAIYLEWNHKPFLAKAYRHPSKTSGYPAVRYKVDAKAPYISWETDVTHARRMQGKVVQYMDGSKR